MAALDYKKISDTIWPIVSLRIIAVIALLGLLVIGFIGEISQAAFASMVFAALIYAYGGYNASSKFNFPVLHASGLACIAAALFAGISSWRGDWQAYAISIAGEGFWGMLFGFIGASISQIRKK